MPRLLKRSIYINEAVHLIWDLQQILPRSAFPSNYNSNVDCGDIIHDQEFNKSFKKNLDST